MNPIQKAYQGIPKEPLVISQDKFKCSIILILSILCGVVLFSGCFEPARADIVSVAQSQIGLGEVGGNNKGMYVRQYLNGRENLPWCAGFVSYCAKKSGYNLPYALRARDYLKLGKKVRTPKPGDLIVFSRQGGGHIGIISKVYKKDNIIITIEGNLGDYPSKVKECHYKLGKIKNFLAFIRLQKGRG